MAGPSIRFEGVSKTYPGDGAADVVALRDLCLEVAGGETLCLLGSSGCGKTTALRMVNRMVEPTAGRVLLGGGDVAEREPVRLRRGIGYVVQSGGLFPHLTVRENVALLCRLEGWEPARRRARADELLARVRLEPERFGDRYPAELSGGQRQRVGVARALALDPDVLLLDEPFGALDPVTRREVHEELDELLRGDARTVLLVTHDLDEAFRLGSRVGLVAGGRLVQVGTPDELRERPATPFVERFLGGAARA